MHTKNTLSLNGIHIETLEQLQENLSPELLEAFRSGKLVRWLRIHCELPKGNPIENLFDLNAKRETQVLNNLYQLINEIPRIEQEPQVERAKEQATQSSAAPKIVEPIIPKNEPPKATTFAASNSKLEFIARDDGTAMDSATGLVWCRYLVGQEWGKRRPLGYPREITIEEALAAVTEFNKLKYGGFKDWRLPTAEELKRIQGDDKVFIGNDESLLGLSQSILYENKKEKLWTASGLQHLSVTPIAQYYGGKTARSEFTLKYARLVRG